MKQNLGGKWAITGNGEKLATVFNVEKIVGNNENNVFRGDKGGIDIAGKGGDDEILAGRGKNGIFGGAGDDTIILGAARKDVVRGQAGQDTFVFATPAELSSSHNAQAVFGARKVVIRDFDIAEDKGVWLGDKLEFQGFNDFADVDQILARGVQQGRDAVFLLDDLSIRLVGVDANDLRAFVTAYDDLAIMT